MPNKFKILVPRSKNASCCFCSFSGTGIVKEKDLGGIHSKLKLKGKVTEEAAPSSSELLNISQMQMWTILLNRLKAIESHSEVH